MIKFIKDLTSVLVWLLALGIIMQIIGMVVEAPFNLFFGR